MPLKFANIDEYSRKMLEMLKIEYDEAAKDFNNSQYDGISFRWEEIHEVVAKLIMFVPKRMKDIQQRDVLKLRMKIVGILEKEKGKKKKKKFLVQTSQESALQVSELY